MLVDLSHVSPATMKDAIAASRGAGDLLPLVGARRSAAIRATCPTTCLQLLPANGGVVMVNFVPGFLSDAVWHWGAEQGRRGSAAEGASTAPARPTSRRRSKAWEAAHPAPAVTVADGRRPYRACRQGRRLRPCRDRRRLRRHSDARRTGLDGVAGLSEPVRRADPPRLERRRISPSSPAATSCASLRQAEAVAASMKNEPPAMSRRR